MTASPPPIDYVERWRRIVVARREQHDAVCAARGASTSDYWARRAEGYRRFAQDASAAGDPFLDAVLRHLGPDDSVLDVGAGTGRHAIALGRHARQVTALDPSAAMLRFLREDAAAAGLTNVDVIEGSWPEAAESAPEADVVICAHVLYPIEEIVPFLRALDLRARRLVFLNLMVLQPWFEQLGLWSDLYGTPRRTQPTAFDAVNVLCQLGCYPNVEIAWVDLPRAFDDLEDAVERIAETLAVRDDEKPRARLRTLLSERLTPLEDGRLLAPLPPYPLATVWWEAGALRER